MTILFISFVAGILTVAAPCVLPLLPVIIGGTIVQSEDTKNRWLTPVLIAASLAVSVVLFSALLKGTTLLLGVPQITWQLLSGVLIVLLGTYYLKPQVWDTVAAKLHFINMSHGALQRAHKRRGWLGPICTGAALGPVFSSCSPTYALILATILPVSFVSGMAYLSAYAVGMSVTLMLIALLGKSFADRLRWLADPDGWFRKTIGVAFVAVGIMVVFGIDKNVQSYILDRGWYNPVSSLEQNLQN